MWEFEPVVCPLTSPQLRESIVCLTLISTHRTMNKFQHVAINLFWTHVFLNFHVLSVLRTCPPTTPTPTPVGIYPQHLNIGLSSMIRNERKLEDIHIRRNWKRGEVFARDFEPKTSSIDPQQLWEVILRSCPWIFWKGPTPFLAHLTPMAWYFLAKARQLAHWLAGVHYVQNPIQISKAGESHTFKVPTYIRAHLMTTHGPPINSHLTYAALFNSTFHSFLPMFWGRRGAGFSCTRGEVLWNHV